MSDKPLLVVINYGGDAPEMAMMDEEGLAHLLQQEQYGADFELHGVYALDRTHEPVRISYTIQGKYDFDENSWAHPLVTVVLPDGTRLQAVYTIDGRA